MNNIYKVRAGRCKTKMMKITINMRKRKKYAKVGWARAKKIYIHNLNAWRKCK